MVVDVRCSVPVNFNSHLSNLLRRIIKYSRYQYLVSPDGTEDHNNKRDLEEFSQFMLEKRNGEIGGLSMVRFRYSPKFILHPDARGTVSPSAIGIIHRSIPPSSITMVYYS